MLEENIWTLSSCSEKEFGMPEASSSISELRLEQIVATALPSRPKTVRPVVVVGAGGIVRAAHLPSYEKYGFPVIGIGDREAGKAAKLAAERGISRSFESIDEAIRFAPKDVVFDIAVPASELLSILTQLPPGAAVLMQKPMGETIDEARAIRDLCRNRGFTAAVNFQLRFAPNHLGAMALAKAGCLGELHDMEVQVRTYTPWHLWTFLATAPRLEILYHSIHYLDLVRAWLGDPKGVYAKTVRNPLCGKLAATKTSMILDYGDDKRVFIVTNHGHDFPAESQRSLVQWEGTNGAIRMEMGVNLDYPTGKTDSLSYAERGGKKWCDVPVNGNWFPDAFAGTMGSLQAYVEGSTSELPTNFESAYRTMALVEAAYRSSERGGEPLPGD
jgi:predicted dehydrogenase